ncbi:hypothetical protein C8T65DRAFT_617082 [Cerioporus squamosus]|nr:hypothetical protein C8T65DRAFT_617082 [Cerioporus squamosus]
MATPQHFEVPYTTPYCAIEPVMEYWNVEGQYETTPEREAHPLCDFIEASSPSTAAAVRQDLMDIEAELSSNYLSLEMADASRSLVPAGAELNLATGKPHPTDDDLALCHLLSSLNFDYLEEPVYQIGNARAHLVEDISNYEDYVALAFRSYHDNRGYAPLAPACVAPADLHKPSFEYVEASTTIGPDRAIRARRALRRESASASPPPITRRPPAQSAPIVPGFSSMKRRNVQVATPAETAPEATAPVAEAPVARNSMSRWKCPHCEFVQWNRRGPDFRRHIATHKGNTTKALYLCCGVPLHEAAEHGVPADILNQQPAREFEGLWMVGGCRRTFSRKDAYLRHLAHQAGRCFGDAQAAYQPGNVARAT